MPLRLYQKAPLGPLGAFRYARNSYFQARRLATVEANAPRQMPLPTAKPTPVSNDRATFTIRVRMLEALIIPELT